MDLLQNPFHLLNASPCDNRRRIMELADERSLLLDSSQCTEARSELTNPRKRLSAEVAWLPGIEPERAGELLSLIESSPRDLLVVENLPAIARANLLAAGLTRFQGLNANDVAEWILELSWTFEDLNPEELSALINQDRVVSGFPEVSDLSTVEAEIQEQRRYYREAMMSALDKLFPKELVQAVTCAVESATYGGEEHGPVLIHDLVDSYEVEAQEFLNKESENINALVKKIRTGIKAENPDTVLAPVVKKLIQVVKNWDTVAQPIQVSVKSRGLDHGASYGVAGLVRALSLDMYNEYGKLDFSQQLTDMLQEVFAEVGKVAECTAEDADALGEIAERRKLVRLLAPISDICEAALEYSKKHPGFADKEAQKVMHAAPQLVSNLSAAKPGTDILSQGRDEIALTLLYCAVGYGNETKNWKPCIEFLEEALKYAVSQEIISRIETNLSTVIDNYSLSVLVAKMKNPADSGKNSEQSQRVAVTQKSQPAFEKMDVGQYAVIALMLSPVIAIVALIIGTIVVFLDSNSQLKSRQIAPATTTSDNSTETVSSPPLYAPRVPPSVPQNEYDAQPWNLPPVALPANGTVTRYHSSEAIAPLTVATRVGGGHYFVKLRDIRSRELVLTVFVREGQQASIKVPLGTYELTYATGRTWYGPDPDSLFGSETRYARADEIFTFRIEGNQVQGYTVELYLQAFGNLETKPISASDF